MLTAFARLPALPLPLPKKQHWPASVVLGTTAFLYFVAALSLNAVDGQGGRAFAGTTPLSWNDVADQVPREPPPLPEPLAFREMTPQDALAYNASIPVSKESNPAARPFVLKLETEADRLRSLDCLTAAVYYEAAVEATDGQRAVAQVVLNRMRHPAFPKTVCGVVFQGSERRTGCQFTFTCDGSMARLPSEAGWARARKVAEEALAGKVYKPVGYATHYHTNWVVPYWSSSLTKLANVGTHIFYRWEGGWGRPPAFRYAHAGVEPRIALMRHLSSAPETNEENALLAMDADLSNVAIGAATLADFAGRPVVRRYEPLKAQAAAAARAELVKANLPTSMRWALTGENGESEPAQSEQQPAQAATPPPAVEPPSKDAATKSTPAAGVAAK